eukprot:gene6640-1185_t
MWAHGSFGGVALGGVAVFGDLGAPIPAVSPPRDLLNPEDEMFGVVDLTAQNFFEHVGGARAAMVLMYAPWCDECEEVASEYAKYGAFLASTKERKQLLVAKMDAYFHKGFASTFKMQGCPTPCPARPLDWVYGNCHATSTAELSLLL